ncbi:MAG: iron ABC transporter permease, partial [Planctomycetes bacterium]|nr:iron ABC transporter permease [Planctomycetota bacterium]
MGQRTVLVTVVLLLVVIGLLPLLVMFAGSVIVDDRLSLVSYKNLLNSTSQWIFLKHSLVLSTLTALLCTLIGMPLGILLAKTDMPCRRTFTLLFTVPLLIPPYIMAVSWFHVLGRQGFLARYISPTVAQTTSDLLFGLPGCVLVLFSTFLPVVMLLTMTFLKTINPRLEEAGKTVSAWPGVLKGITIPLILPGVVLASLLVFLMTLAEFGVPNFLRYNVYPVETFTQFAAFYDFGAATAAALPLVFISLLVLLIERIFLREKTYRVQLPPPDRESMVIGLGKIKLGCVISISVLCFLLVVLPLLILLMQSWS